MLDLARVGARDIAYDLGCGHGHIVIAAINERGTRVAGGEIKPRPVALVHANTRNAGIGDHIKSLT